MGPQTPTSWRSGLAALMALALFGLGQTAPAQAARDDSEPQVDDGSGASFARTKAVSSSAAVQAVALALDGKFAQADAMSARSGDIAAMKAVEWLYLRKSPAATPGAARIMAFVDGNPHWPAVKALQKNAEILLSRRETPINQIQTYFQGHKPISAWGNIALARLLMASGDRQGAALYVRLAWHDGEIGEATEKAIMAEFGDLLSKRDHEARLWRLVMAQETNAAVRAAGRVSAGHVAAAKAAQALIRGEGNGPALYKGLPEGMRNAVPLRYAYARYLRRKSNHVAAMQMLVKTPADHAAQVDPEQWFIEKRLSARFLAAPEHRPHWPQVYQMVARHGFTQGEHLIEGEFLAGWYALRKLGDAKTAEAHFQRMANAAKTRTDGSRGLYWLGRARLAQGNKAGANKAFAAAAASPTLYYGQLALDQLGHGTKPINISTTKPSAADKAALEKNELIRAVRYITQAGAPAQVNQFLWALSQTVTQPGQAAAALDLVHSISGHYGALRLAKLFGSNNIDIDDWSYPVYALPKWKKIGPPIEDAVVFGLTRQESEFNATAKSHAGAQGLMQIMPKTGQMIAKQYGLSGHSTERLSRDPAYNVMLGAAHLGDLTKRYNGSYILAFAGYNAGPGNAAKWITAYGDPRSAKVDAIDWVESVPITETRHYIQKVMQNVHVYRTRLGSAKYGMYRDLARGSYDPATVATPSPAGDTCSGKAKSIASLIGGC